MITTLIAAAALAQAGETVDVEPFSAIDARGDFRIEVTLGQPHAVTIDGDPEEIERFDVDVRSGELRIELEEPDEPFWRRWFGDIAGSDAVVHVRAPAVSELTFAAAVDARVEGIDAETLRVRVSSAADARLSGRCGDLDASASSAADLNAQDLECERVTVDARSAANARVFASEAADATARSAADVIVHGDPARYDERESSAGSVRRGR
ncbi:GIN domain-containing protein [Marinicauda salina]|nr:DUF2807 domain-containing protein [Marinicauda salina]